jgi:D-beta-D-heptose 7-phosphate kinase/D-beta-D-heptose 1-phosphate adenosyltransferase
MLTEDDCMRFIAGMLKRPLVLTNGVFDLLHYGHVRFLHQAQSRGAALMVGINSDASVRALKGPSRPITPALERAELLKALRCVDYAIEFDEPDACTLIQRYRPEVYVKGGDYRDTFDQLPEVILQRSLGGRALALGYIADRSTTRLVERIRG